VTARRPLAAAALVIAAACTRPGEQRALAELEVGRAAGDGITVDVAGGLAEIRALGAGVIELWAQAPVLELTVRVEPAGAGDWTLTVRNAMPDGELTAPPEVGVATESRDAPTVRAFRLTLPAGEHRLRVAPPDADRPERFRVVAMADIQTALSSVDDLFVRINGEPDVRFVVSMGDLTERALDAEYDLFEQQLAVLEIPFFTTLGNHELWADPARWRDRFGRASFQFQFKGAAFTFADSGDASIDPLVHGWIDDWIATARDRLHVFLTHFPPLDPVGTRAGSFRSWGEAHDLLARLAAGGVDLTLYGHIHSFLAFENAGIPAYISGGGGARPERWDGIGRHYLVVDLDPAAGVALSVAVARVD